MFDMPADIPPQIISQQCQLVYEQYIHPANDFLKESYQKRLDKMRASSINAGSDDTDDTSADDLLDSEDNEKPTSTKQKKSITKTSNKRSPEQIVNDSEKFQKRRYQAILEYGLRLGAQEGLNWRYNKILNIVKSPEISDILDTTFNFSIVTAPHGVIYPVISEAKNGMTLSSDGLSARKTRVTWEIVQPAHIVPVTPTWRNYLYQGGIKKHAKPVSEGMMPLNSDEETLWLNSICKGYSEGTHQANLIFSDRTQHLVRDYKGMLRFRELVKMNIVSEPKVIEGRLGVTLAKSGQRVNVDDRMIRIATPALFKHTNNWKVIRTIDKDNSNER